MAMEAVILAPVFLLFLLFLVGAGRVVEAQGEVSGAARDAARAASVQRNRGEAETAAKTTAESVLAGQCEGPTVSLTGTEWKAGGRVRAEVRCALQLEFLGFGAIKEVSSTAVVPMETLRRVE